MIFLLDGRNFLHRKKQHVAAIKLIIIYRHSPKNLTDKNKHAVSETPLFKIYLANLPLLVNCLKNFFDIFETLAGLIQLKLFLRVLRSKKLSFINMPRDGIACNLAVIRQALRSSRITSNRCCYQITHPATMTKKTLKTKINMPQDGIEPPTHGFSVHCSTS
jgi:hypothetical protein